MKVTGQVNFNSHTDAVVAMAVELVNLLTEGERRGRRYRPPAGGDRVTRLTALLRTAGGRGASAAETAEFIPLADQLRAVFERVAAGDIDGAAGQVNELLRVTGARPALERHDGESWHVHFHAADQRSLAKGWAAGCATGLAIVLGGEYHDRLGVCTAPHCDRVYVDTSRNGSRRFCSTACQNRVKAAAFRERQPRSAPGSSGSVTRSSDGGHRLADHHVDAVPPR
jgi:predicted RNA-binding Zn ribbon-like protein